MREVFEGDWARRRIGSRLRCWTRAAREELVRQAYRGKSTREVQQMLAEVVSAELAQLERPGARARRRATLFQLKAAIDTECRLRGHLDSTSSQMLLSVQRSRT